MTALCNIISNLDGIPSNVRLLWSKLIRFEANSAVVLYRDVPDRHGIKRIVTFAPSPLDGAEDDVEFFQPLLHPPVAEQAWNLLFRRQPARCFDEMTPYLNVTWQRWKERYPYKAIPVLREIIDTSEQGFTPEEKRVELRRIDAGRYEILPFPYMACTRRHKDPP